MPHYELSRPLGSAATAATAAVAAAAAGSKLHGLETPHYNNAIVATE